MNFNSTESTRSIRGLAQVPKVLQSMAVLLIYLMVSLQAFAQTGTNTISGQVTDETGDALPGVTVTVKGESGGTVTNIEGRYTLEAEPGSTLVFNFVGYTRQEVPVGNQTTIDVQLQEDVRELEEVVVIGYGTQKKSDVTGAVTNVGEKALQEVPVANVSQALQGRAAGVNITSTSPRPGNTGQIRIRGVRSLSAQNDPLLIVDGIPYGGSINDINTDDIKSVDILKDASSTAIYGSRGANGVIIITTKRGREGKPQLSYNGYYGINTVMNKYPTYSGEEFADLRRVSGYQADTRGSTSFLDVEEQSLALGRETDWQDLVYDEGYITNHDLSISGGTAETQYSLSGGYFKETTVLPGQAFTRYSIRGTIDQQIGSRVKVGLNTMNTLSITDGESVSPMYQILALSPLTVPYDDAGNLVLQPALGTDDFINPLVLFDETNWRQQRRRIRTFNSLYGEVEIAEGLKYRLNVGLDYYQDEYGAFLGSNTPMRNGQQNQASISNQDQGSYTIENLLYYNRTFGDKHNLNVTGLYSVQEMEGNSSNFNFTDVGVEYMQYFNLGQAQNFVNAGGNYFRWALISYMGRINYNYDDRYLFTVTARADGSSRLAPGNKWHYYPALAAGWNIGNEAFLQDQNVLTSLKLRLGYGQTSNASVAPYQTLGGLGTERYNFGSNNVIGYFVSQLPNYNLGWEWTTATNLGLDFGLFRNRITGSLELYDSRTDQLMMSRNLPATAGASNIFLNVGETRNRGVELTLSTVNVDAGDFSWTTDLNFSLNRNEIVALADPTQTRDVGNAWFVGYPVNTIFEFNKIGIWQEHERELAESYGFVPGQIKIEDVNNDGQITQEDRKILGSLQPDWQGGITNRITYKGIDLSMVAFANVGGLLVSTLHQPQSYINQLQGRRSGVRVDYWTPDNPTNAFPQPDAAQENPLYGQALGFYDATFVSIRSINLGYTLPSDLLDRIGGSSLRIYATAQNPFVLFSPYLDAGGVHWEPTGRGGASTEGLGNALTVGLNTPPTRAFILGMNLRF